MQSVTMLLFTLKKKKKNQVENVGKGKKKGRILKGYFGHVVKCAIFFMLH